MKLNLGCGFNKPDGFVHVDMFSECNPDVQHDLESFPWPFDSDSVDEILMNHSLEHLGQQPDVFLNIMKELYRICKHESIIQVNVPHPRHDNFITDPTHVRPLTPLTFQLFDLELNKHWQSVNAANSPFAIYLGVNFKLLNTQITLEQEYLDKFNQKKITNDELMVLIKEKNNVASEYRFTLKVIK
jgi:ubiquinone/menaquinone biosynthesis C-methylase UbiE